MLVVLRKRMLSKESTLQSSTAAMISTSDLYKSVHGLSSHSLVSFSQEPKNWLLPVAQLYLYGLQVDLDTYPLKMGSTSAFLICLVLSLAMPRIQVSSFGSLYGWLGLVCNLGGI